MIHVPAAPIGELSNAWRECVGTGRFSLAMRSDYRDSLALAQQEIGFRYIRGHGILSDDVGLYRDYDQAGHRGVLHNVTYLDQVIDSYLELGIKPFLELGFMPAALASGSQTVFWWQGNVTPPRDLGEWADLIRGLLRHLIDRYGIAEVRTWPVEVWNEPNLPVFWSADQDAYHRLYEASALAVKDVDAELQVGGPSLSPGSDEWWAPFADFVTERALPIDFVSRHAYTSGPAQHVPLGVYQTLQRPEALLEQFAAPRQHLAGTALADLPVHITEFNSSYRPDNPVHDTAFNAAYLAPVLAGGGDLVSSMSYWTFSDMFEEAGVPPAIFHGGFGMLTHRQIKKPTFHLYASLARMGTQVLARGEDHLVTRHADGRITVLAWQPVGGSEDGAEAAYHRVRLSLPIGGARAAATGQDAGGQDAGGQDTGASPALGAGGQRAFLMISSVDETEGNAWAAWREMGRPRSPRARQLDLLHEAAEPVRRHRSVPIRDGRVDIDLTVGRHGVSLVEIDPVRDETPPWLDDGRILSRGPSGEGEP